MQVAPNKKPVVMEPEEDEDDCEESEGEATPEEALTQFNAKKGKENARTGVKRRSTTPLPATRDNRRRVLTENRKKNL
jgi:hypothetical protein